MQGIILVILLIICINYKKNLNLAQILILIIFLTSYFIYLTYFYIVFYLKFQYTQNTKKDMIAKTVYYY